jgi:hypothetical protein
MFDAAAAQFLAKIARRYCICAAQIGTLEATACQQHGFTEPGL